MDIIKRLFNRTHSIQFRFLATVIFAILAIAIIIGGISIYEVDSYIKTQTENFVNVTCENESAKINDSLRGMEKSVKIMESYLMDFFPNDVDIYDHTLQEKVIASAEQMFVDVANLTDTEGTVSYYFRFDPEISDGTSGLFYSKTSVDSEFISFEPTDISLYEKGDTEHVGWFWEPYEAGKPVWMKPYHNLNNNILMISYVIPMYYEEKFIGIVGMDFDYMSLAEQIHEIKIYENGFAHLEVDDDLICSGEHESNSQTIGSKKYLRASKMLTNGMTLVVSADYDDIRQIRYEIAFKIILVVLMLSVFFTLVVIFVVKKLVGPLKKLTDASVKLSDGDYDVEIIHSDTREIKLLSTAFENMAMRLREREETLHISANQDALTGLRNTTSYKSWVNEFNKEIEGKNVDFGVVVLDANQLKETNDKYGHSVGDKLIINASKVIADTFKRSPVFRIGGDEFLVVLQNKDLENCEELFVQLELSCANTFVEDVGIRLPVGIAKGFAKFDSSKDSEFIDVFKRADDAMYENKRKAKATIV